MDRNREPRCGRRCVCVCAARVCHPAALDLVGLVILFEGRSSGAAITATLPIVFVRTGPIAKVVCSVVALWALCWACPHCPEAPRTQERPCPFRIGFFFLGIFLL